jgi:hypothetical protein
MKTHRTPLAFFVLLVGLSLGWLAAPAWAQADPPGRVGRVAAVQGQVYSFDAAAREWTQAEPNLPLIEGDRISTGPVGRAELQVGSTTLRLHSRTEVEVVRLDDEHMIFQLQRGSVALRVREAGVARELQITTPEVRLQPLGAGHFRIDRRDRSDGSRGDRTQASSWQGDLRVDDEYGFDVAGGRQVELSRDGRNSRDLRASWDNPADDVFSARVLREDAQEGTRLASARYVSPEMTGASDLDSQGRWDRHPDWGPVWFPLQVSVGWAPYREGRWTWVRPWGWTWVDTARWGFAPFHYGRWVQWNGRWGWAPGAYAARPVYSPALVIWQGSFSIGGQGVHGPGVGWAPLAPRERYAPAYRHLPRQPFPGRGEYPGRAENRFEERKDWRMQGSQDARHDARQDARQEMWRDERREERREDRPRTVAPVVPEPPRAPDALRRPEPPPQRAERPERPQPAARSPSPELSQPSAPRATRGSTPEQEAER